MGSTFTSDRNISIALLFGTILEAGRRIDDSGRRSRRELLSLICSRARSDQLNSFFWITA